MTDERSSSNFSSSPLSRNTDKASSRTLQSSSYLADNNANCTTKSGKNWRQENRWIGLISAPWDNTKCHPQGRLRSCSDLCCFYQSLTGMPIWGCRLPLVPCDVAVTECDTIPHQRIKEALQVSQNYFCLHVLHPMSRWESSKKSDT